MTTREEFMLSELEKRFTDLENFKPCAEFMLSIYNAAESYFKAKYEEKITELTEAITKLRSINESLNIQNAEMKKTVQDAETAALKKRYYDIVQLLGTAYYQAQVISTPRPKCDKCNKDRMIEFKMPSGKTGYEPCECHDGIVSWQPKEAKVIKFDDPLEDSTRPTINLTHLVLKYNSPYCNETEVRYSSLYENLPDDKKLTAYTEFVPSTLLFNTKEECQKYCDFLNARDAARKAKNN